MWALLWGNFINNTVVFLYQTKIKALQGKHYPGKCLKFKKARILEIIYYLTSVTRASSSHLHLHHHLLLHHHHHMLFKRLLQKNPKIKNCKRITFPPYYEYSSNSNSKVYPFHSIPFLIENNMLHLSVKMMWKVIHYSPSRSAKHWRIVHTRTVRSTCLVFFFIFPKSCCILPERIRG